MEEQKTPTPEEVAAFYRQQSRVLKAQHEFKKLKAEIAEFDLRHTKAVIETYLLTQKQEGNNGTTGNESADK